MRDKEGLISIDNEIVAVITRSGRRIEAWAAHNSPPSGFTTTLHLTGGFVHTAQDVTIDEPLIEVARYRGSEEDPTHVEHIPWSAIESVMWRGGL